jgi:ribosomal protein L9
VELESSGQISSVEQLPEVVDDFIRNYLIKMGLQRTLEAFQVTAFQNLMVTL